MSKRDGLWTRFKRLWEDPKALEVKETLRGEKGKFCLLYKHKPVGSLALSDGRWTFQYSDDFKDRGLRTITEFPDVTKTYSSSELWPFFLMRIPSLRQTSIKEIVVSEEIDQGDELELLRRFGRRTVANPFELVPSP